MDKYLMSVAQFSAKTGLSHTTINARIVSGEIVAEKDENGVYKHRLIDFKKYGNVAPRKRGVKPFCQTLKEIQK